MSNENVIENCSITLQDSRVKRLYTVWDEQSINTGIDIYSDDIYSPCYGSVLQQCRVDEFQSIVIQYNEFKVLRFCHLLETYFRECDTVKPGDKIGKAYDYVHFEYLTPDLPSHAPFAWRFKPGIVYYMHDPIVVFQNSTWFNNSYVSEPLSEEEQQANYEELHKYLVESAKEPPDYIIGSQFGFDLNENLRG